MNSVEYNGVRTAGPVAEDKIKIIGIYGTSGSGKTTLLNGIKKNLGLGRFLFYEGSEVIADLAPDGLEGFHCLNEETKKNIRELAIAKIQKECYKSQKNGLVTGHFMFWGEGDASEYVVCTEADLNIYTHIIYMNISPEIIEQRCRNDTTKQRKPAEIEELFKWQRAELTHLRSLCRQHNILLSVVNENQTAKGLVQTMLRDFDLHNEHYNQDMVHQKLDQTAVAHLAQTETVMVLDGDKTLTRHDTGLLFWEKVLSNQNENRADLPLESLFSSPLGYTYTAFRQATLLYEEFACDETYEQLCQQVASATDIHPEFLSLLQLVSEMPRAGVILISCGLRRVWEIVLERANLHKIVAIIAGGRISDGLVVTADVKAAVVSRLQTHHQKQVWAFGDSPLDLKMLKLADQAFVVVTNEHTRSRSMEAVLTRAVNEGLQAQQILLPNTVAPRLDIARLPIVDITKISFINKLLSLESQRPLSIFIATDAASKLLATPMRDASNSGPKLREAHKQAGRYLAYERLASIIGLEPEPISHVLGHPAAGSKLFNEEATTIVALMRGGDPMACGVSEVFPRAMYVHAKDSGDLKLHHLQDQSQVILVDSVVNTGKSIIEFVRSIRQVHPTIRIFIVAGVIQAQCLCKSSRMYKLLSAYEHIIIVALRVSDTKFTGSGTTDTGNRLFNTTHLP